MAPNKFEKHIKKQFEDREISPSSNAWDTLSEKLDTIEPRSRKKGYLWYGVAASIIGLLIIAIVIFGKENFVNASDNQIVDTKEEVIEIKIPSVIKDAKETEEVVVENNDIEKAAPEIEKLISTQNSELKDQITATSKSDNTVESPTLEFKKADVFEEEIINTKILEIVATVDSLEQNNTVLTNAEVDDLLRNAQNEILRDKLFNQSGSVDAMALLTEVEDELDKSFRDQIFESLKTGFLKVRTAVADRNK